MKQDYYENPETLPAAMGLIPKIIRYETKQNKKMRCSKYAKKRRNQLYKAQL